MVKLKESAGIDLPRDDGMIAFTAGIGERVRELREEQGISRRALSEVSGVSQRYLAKLEAGAGNISVALLYKIANALGRPPASFLERGELCEDQRAISELLKSASPAVKDEVFRLLSADNAHSARQNRVALIGLRGAGKSTLGKYAARRLGFELVELNDVIERQAGMAVGEVIALYGDEGYRRLERKALETVSESRTRVVLATGGGIVTEPDTYMLLLSAFHTVWVRAKPEEHMNRVRQQGDNRPMAGNPNAMEELESILLSREKLYEKAGWKVDTGGKQLGASKAELLKVLREMGMKLPG